MHGGFTILETAILLAVIGIVVLLSVPKISSWYDEIITQNIASNIASDLNYAKKLEEVNYPKTYKYSYYFEFLPSSPPYSRYQIYHYKDKFTKIVDKTVEIKYVNCTAKAGHKILKTIRFNRYNEAIFYDSSGNRINSAKATITVSKRQSVHYVDIVYLTAGVSER